MSQYRETQNALHFNYKTYNRKQREEGNGKLFTTLPIAVASLFIVLLIPKCHQAPQQLTAQNFDSSLKNSSHILERQVAGGE